MGQLMGPKKSLLLGKRFLIILAMFFALDIRFAKRLFVLTTGTLQYSNSNASVALVPPSVPSCTEAQLQRIYEFLPNNHNKNNPRTPRQCTKNHSQYANKCSISQATGCPKSTWITKEYHQRLHQNDTADDDDDFVAINIGCNKGFDAVNLLRMGSNDASVGRSPWNHSLPNLQPGICGQDSEDDQYPILSTARRRKSSRVLCVEPLPSTYRVLQQAAQETGYAEKGLEVLHFAVNNEDPGYAMFPSGGTAGDEKTGLNDRDCEKDASQCQRVSTLRLDALSELRNLDRKHIDYLLIDVEGWDFEVLKGGRNTLRRTAYLEFEYNWRGKWGAQRSEQPLLQAITMLDTELDFTCYWAGNDMLWRITGCWQSHYEGSFWANVACVNRRIDPDLADSMEQKFLHTLTLNVDSMYYLEVLELKGKHVL